MEQEWREHKMKYNICVAGERSSSKPTRAVCTVLAVSPHMLLHETVPVGFFVAGEPKQVIGKFESKEEASNAYKLIAKKIHTNNEYAKEM
jgi:hypothetical protein